MKRIVWILLIACGGPEEVDALDETVQDLSVRSPSDRVVVWQQNIEAMKAAKVKPYRLTNAMVSHTYKPDIVVLAEAWQKVLCGDYLNPDPNRETNNWQQSNDDGQGLATSCRLGRAPVAGSVLERLGSVLWGGAANVGHRRPFDDSAGSTSRTGTAVAWDKTRFKLVDGFAYDDADVPGCSTVLSAYKRVVVLLEDTRRTSSTGDDRLIAVASVHYGSACRGDANRWVAEQMVKRWGSKGLDLRIIGGDFNAEVDAASDTYLERRRETREAGWYRDFTGTSTWAGGRFLDAAKTRHPEICGQWTYPNVSACADRTACAATCPGFGIAGRLERIDFTFVSNAAGTLSESRIVASQTNDNSAGYSDHKASYTVISW